MVCVWPANLSEEPVTTFVESTVVTVDLAHQEKQLMTTNVEKIVACTHSNYSTCTHVPENTRENTRGPRENGNETGNGTQYTDSVYCMSHPATQPLVFPILLDPLYIPTVHFECGLSECRAYLAKDGDEGSRGWGINIYTMNQELDDRLSNGHLPESLAALIRPSNQSIYNPFSHSQTSMFSLWADPQFLYNSLYTLFQGTLTWVIPLMIPASWCPTGHIMELEGIQYWTLGSVLLWRQGSWHTCMVFSVFAILGYSRTWSSRHQYIHLEDVRFRESLHSHGTGHIGLYTVWRYVCGSLIPQFHQTITWLPILAVPGLQAPKLQSGHAD